MSATSRSVGRSEEVNFRRLKNGVGSYGCVASTGRCRLGAELPGHTGMKEQTPTIEIEGPRCKSHYDEAWRAGTEDGAKRIKALRNAVHKKETGGSAIVSNVERYSFQ